MSNHTFRLNERALFRLIDQEAVILNLDSGKYFGLNVVGSRVWELLTESRSMAAICQILASEYDVDQAALETDLSELLDDLLEAGLIAEGGVDNAAPTP
jgi:hypothetical protein